MWSQVKEWLATIGCLDPNDTTLANQLTAREYGYDHLGRTQLESKDDMKGRHLSSPDHADALAFTFAAAVTPRARSGPRVSQQAHGIDWNPLTYDQPRQRAQQAKTDWDPLTL
jgi:hypothetical protein